MGVLVLDLQQHVVHLPSNTSLYVCLYMREYHYCCITLSLYKGLRPKMAGPGDGVGLCTMPNLCAAY